MSHLCHTVKKVQRFYGTGRPDRAPSCRDRSESWRIGSILKVYGLSVDFLKVRVRDLGSWVESSRKIRNHVQLWTKTSQMTPNYKRVIKLKYIYRRHDVDHICQLLWGINGTQISWFFKNYLLSYTLWRIVFVKNNVNLWRWSKRVT